MRERIRQFMLPCVTALLTWAVTPAAVHAQEGPMFVQVACFKTLPGHGAQFEEFLTGDARKLAEASVGQGGLVAWSAARAVIPSGEDAPCDFTVAWAYRGMPSSLEFSSDAALAKVNMKRDDVRAKVSSIARLANTRLWRAVDGIGPQPGEGDYYTVDFMDVPELSEWVEVETKIWKPLHEERVKNGPIKAWSAYALVLPGGADLPFNAATLNVLKDLRSIGEPPGYEAAFKKVHPDVNPD